MKSTLFLVALFSSLFAFGQKTFFIADENSLEPIPFVKVIPDKSPPILADLDGAFSVNPINTTVILRYVGYEDTLVQLTELLDSTVLFMSLSSQLLDPITVLPGVNPAHRIISNAIANRRKNHPIKHDAFQYKSYSKFLFDVDPDFVASIPDDTDDSLLINVRNLTDTMHLFLMESITERYFEPPLRDQERIVGYKISGISDPRFSTFAQGLQSFSFYDTYFEVFGRQYVNPIALGGLNRYIFSLQDTILNATDTTFSIYFRPKKGKRFDGIEGYLYINTNQFAIEKVVAEPYEDSTGLSVKVIQEYAFLDNRRWFPVKLSTEIDISNSITEGSGMPEIALMGTGYTNIEEVTFEPEKVKWRESSVALFSDPEANELTDSEWREHRQTPITTKEENTYQVVDSISEVMNFERILKIADVLIDGKIPLGYVNADISRLYRYNLFERHRIGLGLETSEKLMKPLTIGGYFAYATGDKDWRYGGFMNVHLWRKKQMRLELRYQQDVLERGGREFLASDQPWLSTDSYRNLFISSMDGQRLAEGAFRMDIRSNLMVRISQNYQRITFNQGYQFLPSNGQALDQLDIAETAIELEWNPFAKYQVLGNRKLVKSKKFPTFRMKAAQGWQGLGLSSVDYLRLNLQIDHSARITRILTLNWKVSAAKTTGDVPLFLAHAGDGTRVRTSISTPGAFETMAPASFYNTEQINVFTRFNFKAFKTKATWNEPQISLHHAWGIGDFSNRALHNVDFLTLNRGYGEFGFLLNGILVSQFSGIGVGVFYNYSPEYSSSNWKENVVLKISLSSALN